MPSAWAAAGVKSMTAIIDPHDDRAAGGPIGHLNPRAERQGAMRRGQAGCRRLFAVGGLAAGINRSNAFLCRCGHRYSNSRSHKDARKNKLSEAITSHDLPFQLLMGLVDRFN